MTPRVVCTWMGRLEGQNVVKNPPTPLGSPGVWYRLCLLCPSCCPPPGLLRQAPASRGNPVDCPGPPSRQNPDPTTTRTRKNPQNGAQRSPKPPKMSPKSDKETCGETMISSKKLGFETLLGITRLSCHGSSKSLILV